MFLYCFYLIGTRRISRVSLTKEAIPLLCCAGWTLQDPLVQLALKPVQLLFEIAKLEEKAPPIKPLSYETVWEREGSASLPFPHCDCVTASLRPAACVRWLPPRLRNSQESDSTAQVLALISFHHAHFLSVPPSLPSEVHSRPPSHGSPVSRLLTPTPPQCRAHTSFLLKDKNQMHSHVRYKLISVPLS